LHLLNTTTFHAAEDITYKRYIDVRYSRVAHLDFPWTIKQQTTWQQKNINKVSP